MDTEIVYVILLCILIGILAYVFLNCNCRCDTKEKFYGKCKNGIPELKYYGAWKNWAGKDGKNEWCGKCNDGYRLEHVPTYDSHNLVWMGDDVGFTNNCIRSYYKYDFSKIKSVDDWHKYVKRLPPPPSGNGKTNINTYTATKPIYGAKPIIKSIPYEKPITYGFFYRPTGRPTGKQELSYLRFKLPAKYNKVRITYTAYGKNDNVNIQINNNKIIPSIQKELYYKTPWLSYNDEDVFSIESKIISGNLQLEFDVKGGLFDIGGVDRSR
jgi:hypothetical protein